MRPLQATEILQIWEHGVNLNPASSVLSLLVAACPEIPSEKFHQLTIGERDALLLTQREWMFGLQIEAMADCPNCEERLEIPNWNSKSTP